MVAEPKPVEVKISHPDVKEPGLVLEESLDVWLDLGWSVVDDEAEEAEPVEQFVVSIGEDGEETLVEAGADEEQTDETSEETPLPDEKESDQDNTEDPKEF